MFCFLLLGRCWGKATRLGGSHQGSVETNNNSRKDVSKGELTTLQMHKNQTTTSTASGNFATSPLSSPSGPVSVARNSVVMYR